MTYHLLQTGQQGQQLLHRGQGLHGPCSSGVSSMGASPLVPVLLIHVGGSGGGLLTGGTWI